MLMLGRKVGQKVRITTPSGETIWVTVTEVRGQQVCLGIEAPPACEITRPEWKGAKKQRKKGENDLKPGEPEE